MGKGEAALYYLDGLSGFACDLDRFINAARTRTEKDKLALLYAVSRKSIKAWSNDRAEGRNYFLAFNMIMIININNKAVTACALH